MLMTLSRLLRALAIRTWSHLGKSIYPDAQERAFQLASEALATLEIDAFGEGESVDSLTVRRDPDDPAEYLVEVDGEIYTEED